MSPSKPLVQIRKARGVDPQAVERFVQEEPEPSVSPKMLELANVQTSIRPDAPTSGRMDVSTAGEERRRTTIYFQPETVKALKLRAVEEGAQMSDLVEAAVRQWLEQRASGKR